MSSLDEQTHGEDLDWGEVRSACAERDWRRAWKAVGTDHEGGATPGEIYIFGAARRVSAVSAALRHWYLESLGLSGFGGRDQTWKDRYARIKVIASWESSAAAQHVSKLAVKVVQDVRITVGGVELTQFDESSHFKREAFEWATETMRAGEVRIPSGAQREPMSGTVVMSQKAARQLERMAQAAASGSTLAAACTRSANPHPRGPAQRKRRAR